MYAVVVEQVQVLLLLRSSTHTEVSKERHMKNLVAMPAGQQVCLNQVHVCLFVCLLACLLVCLFVCFFLSFFLCLFVCIK